MLKFPNALVGKVKCGMVCYPKQQIHSAEELPQPLLWPKLNVDQNEVIESLVTFNIPQDTPLIGFCPGAEFGPAKRWPDYHYAVLADMLVKQHAKILIFGSVKDRQVGEQIIARMTYKDQCINLAGETKLEQAVSLIRACEAIVTNDSGLMHVAAALDRPLVALYGPSSPEFTPPLSNKAKVIRLITGYHRVRQGEAEQGYHQSLIDIKPDNVFETLMKLIADCKKNN